VDFLEVLVNLGIGEISRENVDGTAGGLVIEQEKTTKRLYGRELVTETEKDEEDIDQIHLNKELNYEICTRRGKLLDLADVEKINRRIEDKLVLNLSRLNLSRKYWSDIFFG